MTGLQSGELAAVGAAVLWTLSTLAWTSSGRRIGALSVSFHRLMIASVFLALYGGLVRGQGLPTDADNRTWLILGLSGLMGFFVCDLCAFKALLMIGPRLTLLLQALSPPAAAILSWMVMGEMLVLRQWLAMGVTLSGIAWVVLERPVGTGVAPGRRPSAPGVTAGHRGGADSGHRDDALASGNWPVRRGGSYVYPRAGRHCRLCRAADRHRALEVELYHWVDFPIEARGPPPASPVGRGRLVPLDA
jgi:uncharacterized membrane protein